MKPYEEEEERTLKHNQMSVFLHTMQPKLYTKVYRNIIVGRTPKCSFIECQSRRKTKQQQQKEEKKKTQKVKQNTNK